MQTRTEPTRREAVLTFAWTLLTAVLCAGLMAAAALAHAPAAVLPIIVAVCICFPMLSAWQAAPSLAVLRGRRRTDRMVVSQLRRELDALPETHHPLGL